MLKLFISYSHHDEEIVSKFLNHLAPLKNNSIVEEWYDRKILSGEPFQNSIDSNLGDADIICLMISDNFLASSACLKEKNEALDLKNKKGIHLLPIILSACAWMEHQELAELLAIPKDGKPLSKFDDINDGCLNIINSIKILCTSILTIQKLKLTIEFEKFLNSADILAKTHSIKEIINLNDIFTYPVLKKYNDSGEYEKYDSSNFEHEILNFGQIIIGGENQSGKTTLCKVLFGIFRNLNFVPVYLEDDNQYLGNPNLKLQKAFENQYINISLEEIDENRIVPIIDNFHFAKHQDKYIQQYSKYRYQVLIVDDIFGMTIRNENLINNYIQFSIKEFLPVERDQLIKKWIQIKETDSININPNHFLQSLDEKTEMIENSLGTIFGKGIMPSYPFFILSLLAAQEIKKPLDQDITSQGHCYQALIYLYLRKEGVKNDDYDIYSNFLTELAYFIYCNNGVALSNDQFQKFLEKYKRNFNLPIPIQKLLNTLSNVNICRYDSFNHYNFCYSYIYYFFVAKYLAENIELNKDLVNKILNNLHKNENAYLTIFVAHHCKSNYLLDELLLNAEILFENRNPATLDSKELQFFDKHEEKIIEAVLPTYKYSPDEERQKRLVTKSKIEEESYEHESEEDDDDTIELGVELRRSVKTVEVMGIVIKNRAGSLDLARLEYIFEQGLKLHLRILSSFFEIIKNENFEEEIIDFIQKRLNHIIEEKDKELSIDKIEKLAREIFWNLNFGVVLGIITKAIHSLGSNNLLQVAESVCEKEASPSAFIIQHGINMWYGKSLKIDEIAQKVKNKNFSKTAVSLIKYKIVEHSKLHKINFKDLKRIEEQFSLSSKKLLTEREKNKKR